jgi:hypothetical protein
VRAAVARGEIQHVMWAGERPGGGRGFGFTGGHFHWNWGHPEHRQIVLNAIAWIAGAEVPDDGVPPGRVGVRALLANQDYDPPEDFDRDRIRRMLREWRGGDR